MTSWFFVEVGPVDSPLRLRLDLPLLVSEPALAARGTGGSAAFRWTLSVTGR